MLRKKDVCTFAVGGKRGTTSELPKHPCGPPPLHGGASAKYPLA